MKKKIVLISQPMKGLSDEQILSIRNKATSILEDKGYEVMDKNLVDREAYREDDENSIIKVLHKPVLYLSKSVERIAKCDVICLVNDWYTAKGCCIEFEVAKDYDLEILVLNTETEELVSL